MKNPYNLPLEIVKLKPSYVYKIWFKVANKWYIGSRISKSFLASDDLWSNYFTSSKVVGNLLSIYDSQDSAYWEYEILFQYETYLEAVEKEYDILKSIPKIERFNYLNINFSSGGRSITSQTHIKIFNKNTKEYFNFPKNLPIPVDCIKKHPHPVPSIKGFKKWIDLNTFETGYSLIEDIPDGCVTTEEYAKINLRREREIKPIGYHVKGKFWITNGIISERLFEGSIIPDGFYLGKHYSKPLNPNKTFRDTSHNAGKKSYTNGIDNIYLFVTDLVPDGFYLGQTITSTTLRGMSGKKHSDKSKEQMSNFDRSVVIPWNRGLTKETSLKLLAISIKNSINQKGQIGHKKCIGMRKFYNINTHENCMSHEVLSLPWKIGSRSTTMMTPSGIVCNYDELEEVCGLTRFLFKKKMKEFPHEWYYLHPKD